MTADEHRKILLETAPDFYQSKPWLKMQNTLIVSYTKLNNDLWYKINGYKYFDLNQLTLSLRSQLEQDYSIIWQAKRNLSYEQLKGRYKMPDTVFLKSSYKGNDKGHYPNWKFPSKFVKELMSV
jgi:hypothetical protein